MKQKYLIAKKDKKTEIVISEFAELATNEYSLLGEQTYKYADINKACKAGPASLIAAIRSPAFFPPIDTALKIVAAVEELMKDADKESVEVTLDDVRVMSDLAAEVEEIDEGEDIEDIDDMLSDDDESDEDLSAEEDE